ncbi:MAG: translocation/assembly module TamB domain-containing protein [Leadbetterella sp.]|nr:translocation/assembly module TamB domain-containing protein [Leadbetterella sp.]
MSNLSITSEQGFAQLISQLINKSGGLVYSGKLNTKGYKVGDLINNPTLGAISSEIEFKGSGTDLKTANVVLSGIISEAYYEGKKYQNIAFSGDLKKQILDTKITVNDPSASFKWEGIVDLSKPQIQLEGTTKLDFVNLQKLGITKENIEIKGDITLNNIVLDSKSPFIDFKGKNINVYKDNKLYPIGDITVLTSSTVTNKKLEVNTSFLDLSLAGNFDYNQLQTIMLNEINNYFKLINFKAPHTQEFYYFKLDGKVSYDPVFSAFLPDIKSFSDVVVHATLQSEGNIPISGNVIIPFLQYDSIKVYNTVFDYVGDRKALKYELNTKQITNNSLRVRNASLVGKLENNIGSFDLSVKDSLDQDIHSLTGSVQSVNNQLQISFDEDGSMLYYEPWAGNPYGNITYSSAGFLINDVIFTSKDQILRLNSLSDKPNGPLNVFSQNIDLNFLAQAFLQDSAFVAGYADLDLEILNYMEGSPSFVGDVLVTEFEMNKTKLGTLEGKAESNSLEQIRLTATLKGEVSDLDIKGYYYPKKDASLDFNADIKNIDLAAIQYFVKDIISSVEGNVSGKFEIKGSTKKPLVSGEALFPKFNFVLVETGAKLNLTQQKVTLKDQKAIFDHVSLQDEDGKKMDLNGKVDFSSMPNYSYDFDVETDEFKLINAKAGQSELFKGVGYMGANLQLSGRNLVFRLTGDMDVKDKTDLTLLLSDESDAVSEMESVVKFVDFEAPKTIKAEIKKEVLSFANAVNINVDVPTKATLKILMDPITGDLMSVNGSGKLNVGFDNKGDLFILGRYDIETGKYELTYQAIKKAFTINPSSKSHIVWSGDPMSALLDITAEFNAGKKALSTYPFEKTTTKDRLKSSKLIVPIRVDLRVMGILSSPDIKFELVSNAADLSDLKTAVEEEGFRTIADNGSKSTNDEEFKRYQSTINANAIMLLVGGGFNASQIGENITNYENLARQKVSDLISTQLDRYASGLIKGIDLNLGLQSGYNTTNDFRNTNLNLGVSKKLANDRISISVGKNFELENKDLKSDEIFDNIEANWQITKDGRYRLKVFRKNLNQMVIEGSVVETGVGFIIAIDYETWKELMKRK